MESIYMLFSSDCQLEIHIFLLAVPSNDSFPCRTLMEHFGAVGSLFSSLANYLIVRLSSYGW
ncbi:hypothetical protein COCNU_06G014930 [Cocos nucifera]|uniref:Uncharacterized protein n=1 Tax=Cocos nucifera TaxID=13894 RepID=A0A8K0N3N1_COCNU|nr:hypothetical protein COCNU_06G014930 [Cocos nucifera]